MKAPKLASHKVLVIDDDDFMLDLVKALLNQMGITGVQLANNGHDGLLLTSSDMKAPDIIICDLQIPEMEGIEVLRHLSGQSYSRYIILFSGEDTRILRTAKNLATALNLTVLGTLEKPVKYEDMLEVFSHLQTDVKSPRSPAKPMPAEKFLCWVDHWNASAKHA